MLYVSGTLPPVVRRFCKAFSYGMIECGGRHRLYRSERRGLFFENGGGDAELALALKRTLASHHFIQHCSKRKDVAPTIYLLALHLLRRHVLKCADNCPILRGRSALHCGG